jgi:hypothetical protein
MFFCAADGTSIDRQSNRLSIFNVAEEVSAGGFPALHPQLTMVGLLARAADEPAEIELFIRVKSNTKKLLDVPLSLSFEQAMRTRFVLNLSGFVIPESGQLSFELRRANRIIGSWEIVVNQVEESATEVLSS